MDAVSAAFACDRIGSGRSLKTLRSLLNGKSIVKSVGAHDVFSARLAAASGFETIFIGGFGASASLLGMPDLELLTLTEMAGLVRRMASRVSIPIVADGDTGHGGVHNVGRTVIEFESAGASGVVLEDQVSPKRCGHFDGKSVISAEDMVIKLRAACHYRRSKNFVIIARTDAREVLGLNEAVRRVKLYKKAGADVVFIESPHTVRELETIPKKVNAPLLVNMLTGGKTPNLPVEQLEKMGYRIVVYPIESLLVSASAIRRFGRSVLREGSVDSVRDELISFSDIKNSLGLHEFQ